MSGYAVMPAPSKQIFCSALLNTSVSKTTPQPHAGYHFLFLHILHYVAYSDGDQGIQYSSQAQVTREKEIMLGKLLLDAYLTVNAACTWKLLQS